MIDLSRLPEESTSWKDNKAYTNLTVAQVEVLSRHKVPFDGVSCERDGKYRCPTCNSYTMKLIIDYRCGGISCNSRVIKYKIFDTEKTEIHPLYDSYIYRFQKDVERRADGVKKNAGATKQKTDSSKPV